MTVVMGKINTLTATFKDKCIHFIKNYTQNNYPTKYYQP